MADQAEDAPLPVKTEKHRWLRRAYKAAGMLSILGGGGVALHAILRQREKRLVRPPGHMIEIECRKMHIFAMGEGSPTVILESGAAGYFGIWEWVQQEVSKHTRVVSYDRRGLGFSQRGAGKRDGYSIAEELDELLSRAGEHPPYILVGHSFGGLLSMAYAHLYPEKSAGLILIDPHHPDQSERNAELRTSIQNFRTFFHTASAASHFGVMRVMDMLSSMTEGLSDAERTRARAFFVSARHLKSSARELDAWKETADQTRTVHFGALPLVILSAGEPQSAWTKEFQAMHNEMAGRSMRSVHRIVPGAEHFNIVTQREHAKHVSEAILELVHATKRKTS